MSTNNFDAEDIRNVLNLYALAIDTQAWNLFDEVFTPDVVGDYPGHTWTDLETLKRDLAAQLLPYEATQHVMTIMRLKVQGDAAEAMTYGQYLMIRKLGGPPSTEWRGQGWYEDEVIRTAAGWRIKRRTNRLISSSGTLSSPDDAHPINAASIYSSIMTEYLGGGCLKALRK